MSRVQLSRILGSIAAVLASYVATFWLLTLPLHGFASLGRVGWVSAIYCALGVGVYFWAKILTPVAKQRYWSQRNCQLAAILIVIPGCLLFLSGGPILNVGTLLVNQALFTGLLLGKSVYPNAGKQGPFEKESPATLLPK